MSHPIHNRKGEVPADGWFEIEAPGTYPAGVDEDENPREQVLDDIAFKSIVNRFQSDKAAAGATWAGLLVDHDHLSHDMDKSTAAMAWAQDVQVRNGILCAKLDLTDIGEPAVRNRRFKFFSTEYDAGDLEDLGGGKVRPLRLAGLAFTNRPNNRGRIKPISNRAEAGAKGGQKTETTTQPTMKNIATALGLPADADEAAILSAIAKLKSDQATAETENKENAAETIMNRFGDRVPEAARAGWKAHLILNRKATEELMETTFPKQEVKEVEKKPVAPIHNREKAKAPDAVSDGGTEQQQAAGKKKAAAIRNRAAEIQRTERIPWNAAFNRAAGELS
ncbi:phage protease [Luteolibacter sp. LG18]|uniref:phage protease n=1 Tax=Luteolibacter sp. LG18 TaxID=2819286 RepID=UPI002B30F209|nr:hypothetical protein llg_07090 [Luteolibacter sp. LG18]BCU79662.1 hypothetical protein llg_43770 [Luteolibacter sp. LG18]